MPTPFPPGGRRVPATEVAPGTEVLLGASIRTFDRLVRSPGGSLWLVYWRGIEAPTKFQDEPSLMVWPAGQPTEQTSPAGRTL